MILPNGQTARVIFCPSTNGGYMYNSSKGLGISALNTARVLRANNIDASVVGAANSQDIVNIIKTKNPTHIIINALWLPTQQIANLIQTYTNIVFAILVHSNIAFLSSEPRAISLLHEAVNLELSSIGNFNVATNSDLGGRGLEGAWECPTTYLPNLYFLDNTTRQNRRKWSGGTLRIGAYGALRVLKNPTASAFAALTIANNLGTNLEFHVTCGRNDGGPGQEKSLINALQAIFKGLPNAELVLDPWGEWAGFRMLVRNMHLLLQPSMTETFNIVTADGVAEGIASVVSDVIGWAPDYWKASPDNTESISRVGTLLLNYNNTGVDGYNALTRHNVSGVQAWVNWLMNKII